VHPHDHCSPLRIRWVPNRLRTGVTNCISGGPIEAITSSSLTGFGYSLIDLGNRSKFPPLRGSDDPRAILDGDTTSETDELCSFPAIDDTAESNERIENVAARSTSTASKAPAVGVDDERLATTINGADPTLRDATVNVTVHHEDLCETQRISDRRSANRRGETVGETAIRCEHETSDA